MNKVVLLPLDERPCNYDFPYKLFKETEIEVVRPQLSILGDKKKPGNLEEIKNFILEETKDAYGLVISIDTLLYGGIVPSRLHYYSEEELKSRLTILEQIKKHNPTIKIYAFHLIMRCPQYSLSDEEPDYYDECGLEIFKYGFIKNKMELGVSTKEEEAYFNSLNFNKDYLDDFLNRRKRNVSVNLFSLDLVKNNIIDFLIIPQDDAAEYGWTAMDQQVVRTKIEQDKLQLKVYMYPGADEVANTLLSRMLCDMKNKRPLVYIKYPAITSPSIIPAFEDRLLDTTVKYQILAAGGLIVTSLTEADVVFLVNSPSDRMISAPDQDKKGPGYTTQRNLVEFVEFMDFVMNVKKLPVIIGDVAYGNGSDLELIDLIEQKGLMMKLAGYAGWNTSSNTLGTCIPQGFVYLIYGNTSSHQSFLAHRYVEDAGYCAIVRKHVSNAILPNLERNYNYFFVEEQRGIVSQIVVKELHQFIDQYIPSLSGKVKFHDVYMPWRRMFEVGIDVTYQE